MKNQHGGKRAGAGRKKGSRVNWLGMRWLPKEKADVLEAIKLEGAKSISSFVVKASVEVARQTLRGS